jgi:tetratricopeptide (TPR) repeat protein
VFDPHRLGAYLALGQPERAVPMLLQSERDFPDDYNPPARLAKAYLEMKKLDDAAATVERARARVYGPRIMRVLAMAADIAKARGDRPGERKALEEALARTEKATLTAGQKKVRDGLAKRLADLPR